MSKRTSLLVLVLLLLVSITRSARPVPAVQETSQVEVAEGNNLEKMDEECEGDGVEECLMRRTLGAHIDYIYTNQKQP